MKIINLSTIYGPNIFHYKPVVKMTVDLERHWDMSSADMPGFNNSLLAILPGLKAHRCSKGYPGGFIERLQTGTYLAHISEHVVIELLNLCGFDIGFGKSVYGGRQGIYDVVVRFHSEKATTYLCSQAVNLLNSIIGETNFDKEECIATAREIALAHDLGPSTKALIEAAENKGIPWRRLNTESLIQLGYGKGRKLLAATLTSQTSAIAVDIASDKNLTKKLLAENGLPIPYGKVVSSLQDALRVFSELKIGALAIKPLDGNQGRGVSLNISSEAEVIEAFKLASQSTADGRVIIEQYLSGKDYRILVVGGRMLAASQRTPAFVTGDGSSNILNLIENENKNPLRGRDHDRSLTKIKIDESLKFSLRKRGFSLESVPEAGKKVALRETANLSTGGIADDVTDLVHTDYRLLCERASRIIGLDPCGIDLIAPDISQPLSKQAGIVEINAAPGIRMHLFPSAGKSRDVSTPIIEMLYPMPSEARIPIISVTGTNGKTTTVRLISNIFKSGFNYIGLTTTDGIYINQTCICGGDTTGAQSARTVLADPSVEIAILEVARGGIIKRGLGYDWSDIGVITNIHSDHLGQDGLETLEDLANVKSLVAERVKPYGALVINASDPISVRVAKSEKVSSVPRRVLYFSLERNSVIDTHLNQGGTAYFVQEDFIVEAQGDDLKKICSVSDIPLTLNGVANFQVENCLAAVAASRAYGIAEAEISMSLKSFKTSDNNGRMNIYDVNGGIVVVDYAHNPRAFEALSDLTRMLRLNRKVTGVIAIPGDRVDALFVDAAKAALKSFDRIIIREDSDLRGRISGHGARIIYDTIRRHNSEVECQMILNESEALEFAIGSMEPDEVVFHFYESSVFVIPILEKCKARQINLFPETKVSLAHQQSDSFANPGLL